MVIVLVIKHCSCCSDLLSFVMQSARVGFPNCGGICTFHCITTQCKQLSANIVKLFVLFKNLHNVMTLMKFLLLDYLAIEYFFLMWKVNNLGFFNIFFFPSKSN